MLLNNLRMIKLLKIFKKLVVIDSANKVQVTGVTEEYSKLVTISADLKTAGQAK